MKKYFLNLEFQLGSKFAENMDIKELTTFNNLLIRDKKYI